MGNYQKNWHSFIVRLPTTDEDGNPGKVPTEDGLEKAQDALQNAAMQMDSFEWEGWPSVDHIRYNMRVWDKLREESIAALGNNQSMMTVSTSAVLALINDLQSLVDPTNE